MHTTTLLLVILVAIVLWGGYSYYPREGYTPAPYAPFGIGGLLLILVVLYLVGVIH